MAILSLYIQRLGVGLETDAPLWSYDFSEIHHHPTSGSSGSWPNISKTLILQMTSGSFPRNTDLCSHKLPTLSAKTSLKINVKKTEVMWLNKKQNLPIHQQGENIRDRQLYISWEHIWWISDDTKSRLSQVRSLTHCDPPETPRHCPSKIRSGYLTQMLSQSSCMDQRHGEWATTPTRNSRLSPTNVLDTSLNIREPDTISNASQFEKKPHHPVIQDEKMRKWRWIGHTLRKPGDNINRQTLDWNPLGKRKVLRPKQIWRRSV